MLNAMFVQEQVSTIFIQIVLPVMHRVKKVRLSIIGGLKKVRFNDFSCSINVIQEAVLAIGSFLSQKRHSFPLTLKGYFIIKWGTYDSNYSH